MNYLGTSPPKTVFSVTSLISPTLISILSKKQPKNRTDRDVRQISQYVRDKNYFPFLNTYKLLSDLCLNLSVHYFNEKDIILGLLQDLYILVDGDVSIINQSMEDPNEDQGKPSLQSLQIIDPIVVLKNKQKLDKKVEVGEAFGFDFKGKYYAKANTNTTVLKIEAQVYQDIISILYFNENKKVHQFFGSIPLFQKMYRYSVDNLLNSMEVVSFGFNQVLYEEGQNVHDVYIVKEGQFMIMKNQEGQAIMENGKLKTKKFRSQQSMKLTNLNIRKISYKLVEKGEVLGDCEYIFNNKTYLNTLKCIKEGSLMYKIDADNFFQKIFVEENPSEKIRFLLNQKLSKRKKEIRESLKRNQGNSLILRYMPNNVTKTQFYDHSKKVNKNHRKQKSMESMNRSQSFFQNFNQTLKKTSRSTIRRYKHKTEPSEEQRKRNNKTPAAVQDIVEIVSLKKRYHTLRNLGAAKKGAFQINIDNVPAYIKKKYEHVLKPINKKKLK